MKSKKNFIRPFLFFQYNFDCCFNLTSSEWSSTIICGIWKKKYNLVKNDIEFRLNFLCTHLHYGRLEFFLLAFKEKNISPILSSPMGHLNPFGYFTEIIVDEKKNFFAWWFVIKNLDIGYYTIPRQILAILSVWKKNAKNI